MNTKKESQSHQKTSRSTRQPKSSTSDEQIRVPPIPLKFRRPLPSPTMSMEEVLQEHDQQMEEIHQSDWYKEIFRKQTKKTTTAKGPPSEKDSQE